MLTKLLPLLVVGAGVYKNSDKISRILNITTVASVQIEMKNICKVIKLDSVDGSLPNSEPAEFAKYLRANIRSQDGQGTRDYSNDMWGMPYRLTIKDQIATVTSAGPDKKFGTADDIRATTDLF